MTKFSKILGGAAVAAIFALSATGAQATALFTQGSFAIGMFTKTTSDLLTTTTLSVSAPGLITPGVGGGTGSMAGAAPIPSILSTPASIDFATWTGFDFNDAQLGTFTATGALLIGSTGHPGASVTYAIIGTFDLGAYWTNDAAHRTFTADETWVCSQTGPVPGAISCSGTFHSPSDRGNQNVPEPITLSLFGAGLAGAAALRRRRRRA